MSRIINTDKDKCVGCNKCIMVCPIKYANNVTIIDGKRKIEVDKNRCIACGKCLEVCDHNARYYVSDNDRFWKDLKNGEQISIVVAPAFVTNRYNRYKAFFGYLKSLGVNLIYDVSFGADITSWAYTKHLKEEQPKLLIAQPCPSIVSYIKKYATNLIENLAPIHSPVINTAIYMKKYLNVTDKIAFISPCMSKKNEIESNYAGGYIDYNLSFEKICEYIDENRIDITNYKEIDFDNPPAGLGVKFSRPGGLKENLHYHMPDLRIKQLEGPDTVYDYLTFINKNKSVCNYDLLDILNCENGCNVGTASCKDNIGFEKETGFDSFKKEVLTEKRIANQNKRKINYNEYNKLFKYFDENLNIEDFKVNYKNLSHNIEFSHPSDEELEEIFLHLNKRTEASRNINCYSCGYKTCKDMAVAIYNGYNVPSSCYHYNKKELEKKQKTLKKKNKELNILIEEINRSSIEKAENERYVITILEHLTECVIVTDEIGLIEFANKETEKIFDDISTPHDTYIQNLIPELELKEIHMLNEDSYKKEYRIKNIKNKILDLSLECSTLEFKDKKVLIFIIQDITKDKELDNLKNQFISMISHELRTPLTSIRGALGVVLSGALGLLPEKVNELLNIANNNCIRLVNLINDILDLEKIKAGKMSFNYNEYNIIPLIEESIEYNKEYANQYEVNIDFVKNIESAMINVDKDRFIQVLTNLLSNASKYSHKGDTIKVIVERKKNSVLVSVKDYGLGIPKEHFSKIFQSFSQVDSSTTRKKGGTGLGLNICKSIINKMGGNIGFDSEENVGTTFYFEIPEIVTNIPHNKKVLISEDNQVSALCVKQMFKNLGYEADIADNAKTTIELLNKNDYELMTLDIVLPDKNGDELLKEIREIEKHKNLPVIVVSASKPSDVPLIREDDISSWIEKSFDQQNLKEIVYQVLEKKNNNKVKILHVEDDNDILNIVSSTLEDIALITKSSDLATAKNEIKNNIFDFIILDYKLPDGTCENLLENIKNSKNKDTKTIIFSAYEVSQNLSDKVDEVMLKAKVSNEQFINSIKSLINSKKTSDNTTEVK